MSFIGTLAVAGLLIAGAYWFLTNVTFKKDKDDDEL